MTSRVFCLTLVFVSACSLAHAQLGFKKQESFPFLGEILKDNVNVRAGQSPNFESLCRLRKSDQVIVIGRDYSWYKIKLPHGSRSFVTEKYVKEIGPAKGKIIAKDVNVRAGASINATILGQLSDGSQINIIEKKDGWYRIDPIEQSVGWVSDELVKMKSKDLSAYIAPQISLASSSKENVVLEAVRNIPAVNQIFPKTIFMAGKLEKLNVVEAPDILYKLVINEKSSYYLKAPPNIFDNLLGAQVSVEGMMDAANQKGFSYPVITVSKIQLVL